MTPRISAIVPTYNRADLIGECLHSLLSQCRPVSEIIVMDDGSTDHTEQAVKGFGGPIRYFRQANGGKPAALNAALSQVTGDYVWICDDDDIALPEATARLGEVLDREPHGFAYGRFLRFRTDKVTGRRQVFGPGYFPDGAEDTLQELLDDFFIFQFACLVRKEAYDSVGPFGEDLPRSQDYDMILRLARRFTGGYVPEPLYLQREHDGLRGPAAARIESTETFQAWIEYDQRIFRGLHAEMRLEEYVPPSLANAPEPLRERAALLKRACVMARRKLWPLAIPDLERAAGLGGEATPVEEEVEIASRMMLARYGCREVIDQPSILEDLTSALGSLRYGLRIRHWVARPFLWRARSAMLSGNRGEGLRYLRALGRLQGAFGLTRTVSDAVTRRLPYRDGKFHSARAQQAAGLGLTPT